MPYLIQAVLNNYSEYIAVVANGEFPREPLLIQYLSNSSMVIACDGAINNLAEHHIIANYVIGDGDSANSVATKSALNPYILITEQNSNDLTKALKFALELQLNLPIIIFGATGLREDHNLANIALLMQYHQQLSSEIIMLSDYGYFKPCNIGQNIISCIKGQQISLFSFNPETIINCQELKWPLINHQFSYLNSGTLNEALGDKLTISCSNNILVYLAFSTKLC